MTAVAERSDGAWFPTRRRSVARGRPRPLEKFFVMALEEENARRIEVLPLGRPKGTMYSQLRWSAVREPAGVETAARARHSRRSGATGRIYSKRTPTKYPAHPPFHRRVRVAFALKCSFLSCRCARG